MFLSEETDHFDLFSSSEQQEFLYRLFTHVCLGGQICQYEDTLQPYLDFTKALYKDLIRLVERAIKTL